MAKQGRQSGELGGTNPWRKTISIKGKQYNGRELAWLYMTEEWPMGHVAAKDGNGRNTRWENLYLVSKKDYPAFQKQSRDTFSGIRRIYYDKERSGWYGTFGVGDQAHEYGPFPTSIDANKAYEDFMQKDLKPKNRVEKEKFKPIQRARFSSDSAEEAIEKFLQQKLDK